MRNRQFVFAPKIQYQLVIKSRTRTSSVRDKLREANQRNLTFPYWCSTLKIVRTPVVKQSLLRGTAHFAATGGDGKPLKI